MVKYAQILEPFYFILPDTYLFISLSRNYFFAEMYLFKKLQPPPLLVLQWSPLVIKWPFLERETY